MEKAKWLIQDFKNLQTNNQQEEMEEEERDLVLISPKWRPNKILEPLLIMMFAALTVKPEETFYKKLTKFSRTVLISVSSLIDVT